MKRRHFLAAVATAAGHATAGPNDPKLLLPSDTPDEYGFRIMWYNPVPPIDPKTYRLKISGLVERPLEMTIAELRAFPQVTQSSRLKCVQCWSARATWGGFRFQPFLDRVKPKKTARAIRIDCADKWYEYMSLQEVLSPRVLLTLDLDGKPLPGKHGAPLRLIDPSKYGYKSAKLITSLQFVEEGKGSMACDIGPYYSPTGEILPGYDHPLDLGSTIRKKIKGGEITEY
jgi:DMSO/TMAO reductase YedYZ molybdopterin-dependent catalytic subunit